FFIFILLPPAMAIGWRNIFPLAIGHLSQSRLWRDVATTGIIYLLGIFVLFNVSKAMGGNQNSTDYNRLVKLYFAQMPIPIDPGTRPFWGTPNAPVTIIEFSDFQCPYCRVAAANLKPSLAEYKKEVVFYFANYPLDSSCNPNITRPMHTVACTAAKAVLCAEREGKFWSYHDKVFENQKKLSKEMLLQIAESLEMNKEAFVQCLESEEINAKVKQDIELGTKLDVHGTPSIFINGRSFPAWRDREALRTIVDEELKRARK
ncbi:MAG: DsbA family protein, partial [Deltaproteobacteria bacterium]|nr:DsbA family protein [Deltaproteobacteria bacterium]